MALFFRIFSDKTYQKLTKNDRFSPKINKKLSKSGNSTSDFPRKKSAIYFGKLPLFSKILTPVFRKSEQVALDPQKKTMYLINFFCGFFVKLSSALSFFENGCSLFFCLLLRFATIKKVEDVSVSYRLKNYIYI